MAEQPNRSRQAGSDQRGHPRAQRRGLCGAVRFSVRDEPLVVAHVIEPTAARQTGAAFVFYADWPRSAFTSAGQVQVFNGRSFCPACGSRVFHLSEAIAEVMIGALDDDPGDLCPTREGWTFRREHWLAPVADAAQFAKEPAVIWGGEHPEFETETEMRIVLGTIMGRYNEIVGCLDSEPEDFEPIFMEGPENEVIASDWASGFLDAISLRPKAWEPLIAHHRAGIMIMPILLLSGDAQLDTGLTAQSIGRRSWQRCPTSSQPALPVSTSSGRTAGPIASQCQGGIEAAAEVAGAIDRTAHTNPRHG